MHNENLSAQQSLDIITSMIRQAKGKVSGNSFHLLLWGWCIALANFGMYGLIKFSQYERPYLVWLITIPAWGISLWHGAKRDHTKFPATHLDKVNMWLWISMGIALLPICAFGYQVNWNISPFILLAVAVPTFVSGVLIRFKPLIIGGICFWLGGIVSFLVAQPEQYLVGGIAVVLGYLVPGYLLRTKNEA